MEGTMDKLSLLLVLALTLPGCAHVISEETRKQVDKNIDFSDVKMSADAFIGKKILVGGKIAGVRNYNEGGRMEVVQFTLDNTGFPIEVSRSAGRFIATSPDFIDPIIYKAGRLVTLAGEVKGKKTGTVDGAEYTFPVIGIKEIFAWKQNEDEKGFTSPAPSFYNNYNPYDFSHDVPLWYRPTGPVFRQ